jgi:hypothetical protein
VTSWPPTGLLTSLDLWPRGEDVEGDVAIFPLVFYLVAAAAVIVAIAAAGSGRLHQDLAKELPFIRHPELVGTLDLTGQISSTRRSAMQKPPAVQFGGSCATYANRTSWDFRAKLPNGSSFTLQFSVPLDQGGPGTYRAGRLRISAEAENAQQTTSWSGSSGSVANLTLTPGGGGLLTFSELAANSAGGRSLSGQLSWTCSVR